MAAKHSLTQAPEVRVRIENLYRGGTFNAVLTRPAFEAMCRDLFHRLRSIAWGVSEISGTIMIACRPVRMTWAIA